MFKINRKLIRQIFMMSALLCALFIAGANFAAQAQTTLFTYQGRLTDSSVPATGTYYYDMVFRVFTAQIGGVEILSSPLTRNNVPVVNGVFTVRLTFGPFQIAGNYLEISLTPTGTANFTTLTPRQLITAVPYSVFFGDADKLGGVDAGEYFRTTGILPLSSGGTGSSTKSFVDLSTAQTVNGTKTFNSFLGAYGMTTSGPSQSLTLSAPGNVFVGGGLVSFGTFGTGTIPATGAGTRMMFYPGKAAFRAGRVTSDQWDDANIGDFSTALGFITTASGDGSTAIGSNTTASGNYSTAMGIVTTASGNRSTALGSYASTGNQDGSFVYGDDSITSNITSTAPNQFVVRAQNIWLGKNNVVTNTANRFLETSTGAYLSTGGTWTNSSSVKLKTNFAPIDSRVVLRKVLGLPLTTWNYKTEDQRVVHLGAMAQDFRTAFNLGADDEHISTVDADGVALAAIQGLNAELKDELGIRDAQITRLQQQIKQQQIILESLKRLVCAGNSTADVCKPEGK